MASLEQIMEITFWNNQVVDYAWALGIFIVLFLVLRFFKFFIIARLRKLSEKTKNQIDDILIAIIDSFGWFFFLLLSLFIALKFIETPPLFNTISNYAMIVVFVFYVMKAIGSVIDFGTKKAIQNTADAEDGGMDESAVKVLSGIIKGIFWLLAIVLLLQNFGVEVTTLIAGIGIGGIAIAFALQAILADIFASFSIYFDKPFRTGDFLVIGDDMGVVKKIGIKTTRLQTLQGQELIVSNRELTETRVNNFKRMEKRRVVFNIGVTYQTSKNKLKKIPSIIKKIIDKIKLAELDRAHFNKFGDSALGYEVVYYIDTSDYNKYMDVQQEINLKLVEAFAKEKIEFAYPTQTLFLEGLKKKK